MDRNPFAFATIVLARPLSIFGRPVHPWDSSLRLQPGGSPQALQTPPHGGRPALRYILHRPARHYPHVRISTRGPGSSGTLTHLRRLLPGTHYEGSDSCPCHLTDRSPCLSCHNVPAFHLQPRDAPRHRFVRQWSAFRTSFGLRHALAGSSLHPAESSSSSCRPLVHLRLLPTPPHGNAVSFGYEALACLDPNFHRAVMAPSQAHSYRRKPGKQ
jgi:hypothetical protein